MCDIIWVLIILGIIAAISLIIIGVPTLLIGSWLDRERIEAYYRPLIEAEHEDRERRRMDVFLGH
jgi:hypothetical protein